MEQPNVVSDVREPEVPRLGRQDPVAAEDAVGDLVHVLHASVEPKLITDGHPQSPNLPMTDRLFFGPLWKQGIGKVAFWLVLAASSSSLNFVLKLFGVCKYLVS